MIFRRGALVWVFAVSIFFQGSSWAVEYTGQDARDPFSSPGILSGSRPDSGGTAVSDSPETLPLRLQGIIWVPKKPRAIINGRRVVEGAEINGAKVVEIRKKEVTILFNGREVILKPQREN